jgi:hypothetical protein
VIEAIHALFPLLRQPFADGAYAGQKPHDVLLSLGVGS